MMERTCSNCAECEIMNVKTKHASFKQFICSIEGIERNPSDTCILHITDEEVSEEYEQ